MKRSRHVGLVLMGASPLLLTACAPENSSEEGLYTSVEACVAQTGDETSCRQAHDQAQREFSQSAPRYATREECIAVHGADQCQQVGQQHGGSIFMPLLAGYVMGRMLSGGNVAGLRSAPAFRDRNGGWQRPAAAAGGVYRQGAIGQRAMAPIQMAPNQAPTVTRGGFGNQDRRRSSGS